MAVEEIHRNVGTQFDPDVVRSLVECTERGDLALVPRAESTARGCARVV